LAGGFRNKYSLTQTRIASRERERTGMISWVDWKGLFFWRTLIIYRHGKRLRSAIKRREFTSFSHFVPVKMR
jgi:hypothetical protein